jgi:phospholipid-translocating ATPase
MAIAAVMVTDLFVGLETYVWTAWVFFAVFAGIIIVVVYTVSWTRFNALVCEFTIFTIS